jgi:hypothetical protein
MGIESLTDESVLRLYESIRQQVEADTLLGSRHRLLRETAKQEAERLRAELDRRRLRYAPIIGASLLAKPAASRGGACAAPTPAPLGAVPWLGRIRRNWRSAISKSFCR